MCDAGRETPHGLQLERLTQRHLQVLATSDVVGNTDPYGGIAAAISQKRRRLNRPDHRSVRGQVSPLCVRLRQVETLPDPREPLPAGVEVVFVHAFVEGAANQVLSNVSHDSAVSRIALCDDAVRCQRHDAEGRQLEDRTESGFALLQSHLALFGGTDIAKHEDRALRAVVIIDGREDEGHGKPFPRDRHEASVVESARPARGDGAPKGPERFALLGFNGPIAAHDRRRSRPARADDVAPSRASAAGLAMRTRPRASRTHTPSPMDVMVASRRPLVWRTCRAVARTNAITVGPDRASSANHDHRSRSSNTISDMGSTTHADKSACGMGLESDENRRSSRVEAR